MSGDPIDGIRHLVDNEDYQKAIPHLEEKRREIPVSAGIVGVVLMEYFGGAEDIISLSLTIGKPTTKSFEVCNSNCIGTRKKA